MKRAGARCSKSAIIICPNCWAVYERRTEKLPAWNEGSFECDWGYVLERWGNPITPVFIKLRATGQ
jgi:hypothetical protein